MGRGGALGAEVLDRGHDTSAEQHLPEPVDRDAGRQRVGRVRQPAGESEPVVRLAGRQRGQRGGQAGGNFRPGERRNDPRNRTCVGRVSWRSSMTITVGSVATKSSRAS